jgi:hypothetical protein
VAEDRPDDDVLTAKEEQSWLRSTALWSVLGGVATIITAITAVLAVYLGLAQIKTARELQAADNAYQSWNALNQATLDNPDLACADTEEKFAKLMSTPDPKSAMGNTYRERYTAYGYMVITTSEQILRMAPDDPHWKFLISERIKCTAPAIRYLQREGTYEKRYSCGLRRVIAGALNQPAPTCLKDEK